MELRKILACTLGDEHLKDFPMLTLNCHKDIHLLPPPRKCYMGLHVTREGEALRAWGPSYFLNLQHTVKTQTNQPKIDTKMSEILNPGTEMKISVSTLLSPGPSNIF